MTIATTQPLFVAPLTVPQYVLEHAARHGERPALVDGPSGRTLTYVELEGLARRCAAGLAARGLAPGETAALFAPNLPEFAVAYYGTLLAGGICTTVSALATTGEVHAQLSDSGARFLVTVSSFLERALPAARETATSEVFTLDGQGEATPFAALLGAGDEPPDGIADPAGVAALPYSSGTTGTAKGVMLTHANLVANAEQVLAFRPYRAEDVQIGILPFFHSYGQTVVLNAALRAGSTVVTMPRFDLEQYLALSERHRATLAYVAPPVVLALARQDAVARHDLSSLRSILSGAAPLDSELAAEAAARVGCEVVQGYGMTEASPVTHMTPFGAEPRPGSVGPLVPGTEARIVDVQSGEEAGPGETGELLVRGPQVMKGYLNNPEATAATIVDGWLRTGDVARADESGWTTIVDRIKELIKVKGMQVAPAELEALLLGHPAIADACVIGIPDEAAGEVPKGFVVLRSGASPDEIAAYVQERVPAHKRLRAVEVVDAIPKSPSGKILRRVLAERAGAAGEPRPG